jgi:acetyltransferase-like isoleucine patch superfamily enzyme
VRGTSGLRAWARRRVADGIHRGYDRLNRAAAIGPDCALGSRFREFGLGSCISFPTGTIYGEANIEIGSGTMIGTGTTLSAGFAPGQNLGDRCIVRIGDRVLLGRGSHVVGHSSIDIGDDVYTGPYVYITDQNHTYADPDIPIGRQWPTNQAVHIGAGSWLGTGVVVLPGADIGRNVVVAAGSIVRGEVPDHCVVAGVPARVIRRWTEDGGWEPPIPGHGEAAEMDEADLAELAKLLGLPLSDIGPR